MKINVTYDASVASAPAGYKAAVAAAVLFVEKAFVSPITVNLTFAWGSSNGGSATSLSSYETFSYASVVAALKTKAAGNPLLANEVLPATDPFGDDDMLSLTTAYARQLGLDTGPAPAVDSTITLGSSFNWNFDPSANPQANQVNAVGTFIHEITEALGRQFGSDGALTPSPGALFRYTAAGQIDTSAAAGGYLSLNGGQTNLVVLGNTGGDLADFNIQVDPFGIPVYGTPNSVTQVDVEYMEALGYNATNGVNFGGGANVAMAAGNNNSAVFFNSNGAWDTATGSNGSVLLWNDQASVVGANDTITFYAGLATARDAVSLYSTNNNWDTVNGSNSVVTLVSAQASITGGDDLIYLNNSNADAVSLYATAGVWDRVQGSSGNITLVSAQASVTGGSDNVYFDGSSSDAVSLYGTSNNWDNVYGSSGNVTLVSSQASVIGGGDNVYLDGSASDAVSLYSTKNVWDNVQGSNGTVLITASQTSVTGGGDNIYFDNSNTDAVSLYGTAGAWDNVTGSNGTVVLTASQASVTGGADYVYLNGAGDSLSLYGTGGKADIVSGSSATVILNSAQASLQGGWDTVDLNGTGDIVTLTGTGANQDWVYGSTATVNLTGATASVNGASDTVALAAGATVTLTGTSETLSLGAAFGIDSATGFVTGDTLSLSKTDWASFAALQSSGDLIQSGNNTQIKLDANDVLTLVGVAPSVLSASNTSFVGGVAA